jgi:hypothetical protein
MRLGDSGYRHGRTSKVGLFAQSTPGNIRKKITIQTKNVENRTMTLRRKIPADYNNEITALGKLLNARFA